MRELDRGDTRALFCRIARDNTATPGTEPAFRHVDLCAAPVSRRRLWPIKPQSRDKLPLHPRSGTARALIPRPPTLRHRLGRVNPRTLAYARCGRAVGHAKRATCRSESAPRSQTRRHLRRQSLPIRGTAPQHAHNDALPMSRRCYSSFVDGRSDPLRADALFCAALGQAPRPLHGDDRVRTVP
jgi:hypothetical protein